MVYLLSIISGIIQGITEFLPISSSGHLILFRNIFQFNLSDNLLFDVVLHLGTLTALIFFFYQDIWRIIRGVVFSLMRLINIRVSPRQVRVSQRYGRLAWLIIIATIPSVLIGYFFEDFIQFGLRKTVVVAVMLILVAILFLIVEKQSKQKKKISKMSLFDGLLIGLAQVIAFIPGTSRSGITIIAGMSRNMNREEAARFSFLLGMPVIFGAGLKEIITIKQVARADFMVLFLGFIVSAAIGYLSIKYLLKYLSRHSLNIFSWYRLIIGCLILIWFFLF